MKLATSTGDFAAYTSSQAEALRWIRQAGFTCADYNFGSDYRDHSGVYSADHKAYFEELRRAADAAGIRLVQAHSPMGAPIAPDNEQFIEDTLRCVDACGAWGIPNLVVHSGYRPGLSVEETFAENRRFFAPILARAEKYGVNILVENFNKRCVDGLYWIDNAADLLGLIECVDHPLFHAVWDAGHANMQDMPQDEELQLLGSHVRALHIQDNGGGKEEDTHLMPFFGTLNLDAVMHGLQKIGYSGYFTFEVGAVFTPAAKKRQYPADTRLLAAPLELKQAAERFLYEMGRCILSRYGCLEE